MHQHGRNLVDRNLVDRNLDGRSCQQVLHDRSFEVLAERGGPEKSLGGPEKSLGGPEKSLGGPSKRPGGAPRGLVGADRTDGPVGGTPRLCADIDIGAAAGPVGGEACVPP